MQKEQKRFRRSLLAMFVLLAAVVVMMFSSTAYAASKYKVYFSGNGGSVSKSYIEVMKGKKYNAFASFPTATKTGHSLAGWYTASSGGTRIYPTTTVNKTSSHTLYAHWTANKYRVSFNPSEGSVSTKYKDVTYGTSYGTLPGPSKYGYTFSGWYTGTNGTGTRIYSTTTMNKAYAHTLYAYWVPVNRMLLFDANGGSVNKSYQTITYNKNFGSLPTPTRSGYTFAGWSKTQYGTPDYVYSSTKLTTTSNIQVYARWYKNVTFVANGGTSVTSRNYLIGKNYGSLPTTSRSGHRFLGWYRGSASGVRVYESDDVLSLGTLYARWEPITGTFKARSCHTYDRNGNPASSFSAESHKRAFTANDSKVQGLRNVVRNMSDSKQKYAALYALDAVGSYYCQEQRNTIGAYDCSSLVSRAYTFAGENATFGSLPVTGEMKPKLDALVNERKAELVTNGQYQTGDIMFNNSNYTHVSIYIGTYGGVRYRVAAECHSDGVGYYKVEDRSYSYVYRLK